MPEVADSRPSKNWMVSRYLPTTVVYLNKKIHSIKKIFEKNLVEKKEALNFLLSVLGSTLCQKQGCGINTEIDNLGERSWASSVSVYHTQQFLIQNETSFSKVIKMSSAVNCFY